MLDETQVVVAIDFGTTFTKVAIGVVVDNEPYMLGGWPKQPNNSPHALPTEIVLTDEQSLKCIGFEAKFHQMLDIDNGEFFSKFKMDLVQLDESPNATSEGSHGSIVDTETLITEFLHFVNEHVCEHLGDAFTEVFEDAHTLWVVTVPAIWNSRAKELMARAAMNAGIVNSIDDPKLQVVTEPEAAAIHCLENDASKKGSKLVEGTSFLVIDAGGGTIDLTSFKVVKENGRLRLKQLSKVGGGAWGSTFVNNNIKDHLDQLLLPEIFQQFKSDQPQDYFDEVVLGIEDLKLEHDPDDATPCRFSIPSDVLQELRSSHPEVLEKLASRPEQNNRNNKIFFSNKQMAELHREQMEGTLEITEKMLTECGTIDYLFLVGGFAESKLLQQAIKKEFEAKVKKIVTPPRPQFATVKGAFSYGVNPSTIKTRKAERSYGTNGYLVADDSDFANQRDIEVNANGEQRCERFVKLISKGTEIETDEPFRKTFYPLKKGYKSMKFCFFSADRNDIRYIDDSEIHDHQKTIRVFFGEEVDIDREVEMRWYVVDHKLARVEVEDIKTGNIERVTLPLSSSYLVANR